MVDVHGISKYSMSNHVWFIIRISDEVCPQVIVLKNVFS